MNEKRPIRLTSAGLHILAMAFMLCDHIWGSFFLDHDWLTCVGRMAFPIFAFLLVEGYCHTGDVGRYLRRLLAAAVLSEIPFNMMNDRSWIYPFHQNVLWTFLLALLLLCMIGRAEKTGKRWLTLAVWVGAVVLGYVVGSLSMIDYGGGGVLTVLAFYLFRGRRWYDRLGQLLCLSYINLELLGGYGYILHWGGSEFFLAQQIFALPALLLIWLYRGEQGYHSRGFRTFCYAFYPVHMLLFGAIQMFA